MSDKTSNVLLCNNIHRKLFHQNLQVSGSYEIHNDCYWTWIQLLTKRFLMILLHRMMLVSLQPPDVSKISVLVLLRLIAWPVLNCFIRHKYRKLSLHISSHCFCVSSNAFNWCSCTVIYIYIYIDNWVSYSHIHIMTLCSQKAFMDF
jgi:hypothetical protein